MLRRQLPVYSPVTWRALLAGARAAVVGDRGGLLVEGIRDTLASRYGAKDVLLTDSGTSALRLAIGGAIAERRGPVALPAYSCYDLSTAAEGAGAHVVMYDLDPRTLGPAAGALEQLAPHHPSAVVVAHLFGYPADPEAVQKDAGESLVIEDAAQGAGGRLRGRSLGSFGSLSVLSFGRGKGMTGGGGGALLSHDDRGSRVLDRARGEVAGEERRGAAALLALAGQWLLGRPSVYGIPAALPFLHLGEAVYHPPRAPRPAGLSNLAVLERVMSPSHGEVPIRRQNAERLGHAAAEGGIAAVGRLADAEPGYLRLPLLVREAARRSRLLAAGASLGIGRAYPIPLSALPSMAAILEGERRYPEALMLAESLVTVPTHGLLGATDLDRLEALLAT